MFTLLETKQEIAKAQSRLEATIRREFNRKVVKNIGYPGGTTHDAKVLTNGNYWFWSADDDAPNNPNPRHLNWFGLFREDIDLQITVEINTSYEGRNDRLAGFFGQDTDTGSIYLMHSGGIGGGTKGVGKATFLISSDQRLVEVADSSGGVRKGVLVLPVEGIAASRSAIRYIDAIASFKLAVRAAAINTPEFRDKQRIFKKFYNEKPGRRQGRRSREIDYLSRHGDVVDALHAWRKSRALPKGGRLVKNVLIDMGIAVDKRLVEVFEVKTSTSRSDIYAAIGQLMVHGTADNCRRVMVLPHKEPLAPDIKDALERLKHRAIEIQSDQGEGHNHLTPTR